MVEDLPKESEGGSTFVSEKLRLISFLSHRGSGFDFRMLEVS